MGDNFDFTIANLGDGDAVTKVASSTLNLDAIVEEFLECGKIENLVADWLGAVDGVLYSSVVEEWSIFKVLTFEVVLAFDDFTLLAYTYSYLAYCSCRS